MSKKEFSEEFQNYLKKSKIIKHDISELGNIEQIVSDSIIKSFAPKERTYTLTDFGHLEKKEELKDGKKNTSLIFVPSPNLEKKVVNKYKMNIRKKAEQKKLVLFSIVGVLVGLLLIFLIALGITSLVKSSQARKAERLLHINDATDDVMYSSKDDTIIIAKDTKINPNLKNGEYTTEEITMNGIVYTKITYKVKYRDFLWKIGYRFVKDKYAWKEIHKDNPSIKNPHLISTGEQIIIFIKK